MVNGGHTFDLLPLNCGPDVQVNYFTYKQEDFTCQYCGWKGKGAELSPGDFSEAHSILDLDCPSCYEHLGFWQAPLIEEVEQWKNDHPGWPEP